MDRARLTRFGSAVALLALGSLLMVYGFNAGHAEPSRFSLAYYLTAVLGGAVAAAGVLGFRRLGRAED